MKTILLSLFGAILFASAVAQDGEKNAQSRTVDAFHGVSVSGGIDLYLTEGSPAVSVTGNSADAVAHVVTGVEHGILKIYMEKGWHSFGHPHLKAFVSTKNLDHLSASGGSDTWLKSTMHCGQLQINLSGGSDLHGAVVADELTISQSGGSDADLTGTVKTLSVEASGGSDIDGFDLVTDNATITTSGGSDATLTVNKMLRVEASGGSDVHYKGSPGVTAVHASGSSSVVKKG